MEINTNITHTVKIDDSELDLILYFGSLRIIDEYNCYLRTTGDIPEKPERFLARDIYRLFLQLNGCCSRSNDNINKLMKTMTKNYNELMNNYNEFTKNKFNNS